MEPVNSRIGRPFIAKSYGIAAGDAGLMDWSWVDAQMANSRNYWIGSTRPDGRPHVSPVWGVWLGGALYFGGDVQARRSRNLAANPQVVAHLESGDEVVMIEGGGRSSARNGTLATGGGGAGCEIRHAGNGQDVR